MKSSYLCLTLGLVLLLSGFALAQSGNSATNGTVSGNGTPGFVPVWLGPATLGNSTIIETKTKLVGVGTKKPVAALEVQPPSLIVAVSADGANAPVGSNQNGRDGVRATGGTGYGDGQFGGDGLRGTGGGGSGGGAGIVGTGGTGFMGPGSDGAGLVGIGGGTSGDAVDGIPANGCASCLAGDFFGGVVVSGTLTATTKHFRIDHPLDPGNKYLVHASVENPIASALLRDLTEENMAKRILMLGLVCFGVLEPAGVILKASDSEGQGVISFRGRANWALATMPSPVIHETDPNPAKLATIFSNLGGKGDLYEKNVSWDVAGPDSGVTQQWVAMPFTPTFDAEVTRIVVAVAHNSGSPNSFVLSLNADGGGLVPGKVIHRWIVTHAPKFGTCCTLDVANDAHGLKVHKGTQYWVVSQTDEDDEGTRMEWDLSPKGIEGNFALNNGTGWSEFTAFTSAFAVYGTRREFDPDHSEN